VHAKTSVTQILTAIFRTYHLFGKRDFVRYTKSRNTATNYPNGHEISIHHNVTAGCSDILTGIHGTLLGLLPRDAMLAR